MERTSSKDNKAYYAQDIGAVRVLYYFVETARVDFFICTIYR